jgi:signal transduction histidine kinase
MVDLGKAAHALAEGGDPPRVDAGKIDEVREVTLAFDRASMMLRERERAVTEALEREQHARQDAEQASKAKDQFLAMLGHELRNPLAALLNAASLLRLPKPDAAIVQRASDVVQRQVTHLARLTDDLLVVARALMGKVPMQPQRMDLGQAAAEALATLQATGRTAEHHVAADLGAAWIDADPVRIDQIITNLVVNAVKYTPRGGTIRVRTAREEGQCVLAVADDGIGLSPELAARAFDIFVQGTHAGVDRVPGGLGIGLTLVRRLAELHGGSAVVKSDGEGKGSEFIVRFPCVP